ncbi:WcaI family glycosyltransferase [Caulobacter sp. 73W]|uniref:WcaI family glycosyltransferase n=1 Tax=Caulobacter sp. 73W TaxID=3161137 RepID=A0AB39KWF3_9CAUL
MFSPKRILIVALNYAPELVGCAKYTTELAEDLACRGHKVEVVCAPPYYPHWRVLAGYSGARWTSEHINGVRVNRAPLYVPPRPTGLKRIIHLASFGLSAGPAAVFAARRLRPDVVFTVAPTLASSMTALLSAQITGAKKWLHIQDFEVDAAFELGLLGSARSRAFALKAEKALLNSFDIVSTISPAMAALLGSKGVPTNRVVEFRNWVDVDAISMHPESATNLRAELQIGPDKVVALYSGNMAAKQGIEMLAEVARGAAASNPKLVFLFCGDGPAKGELEHRSSGLGNVRFLPLQPLERLSELLATADIHLLPQRPEAADLVLPSKLTGMLASGRPVVAMAPNGSGLAQEVEGCGIVVQPTAPAMAEAVFALSNNPTLRKELGTQGRRRAEERWRKSAIIDGFERHLSELQS